MVLKHTFTNKSGEKLSALIDLPSKRAPIAFAIFAHCFTCSKDIKAAFYITSALIKENIAVLRFDFTGLGESEGAFHNTNFSSNVDDIVTASDFLKETFESPCLLIGHSLGGAAVIEAAPKIPSTRAVVTIGTPFGPKHVALHLAEAKKTIDEVGEAEVTLSGRKFKMKQQFFEDLNRNRFDEVLGSLEKALLVIHSPMDDVVGIDQAGLIFKHARHPKSFISIDRADHLLSQPSDASYVGGLIAAWAKRYFPPQSISQKSVRH